MYKHGRVGTGTAGGLAVTGASLSWWIALAVALVALGTMFVLFARRRRRMAEESDK
ncbi:MULTISPECIES: LPXTG cell wall anchor domain-containing protein [Amycolatopsis]|uniref:LPXTG cell wall anchor domain-containing protein n=1 Tax=Amycolatopsis echigonensis TaxID=2576905 RepID=A0A2N3WNH2_9PSEU|nr:MULTISPECIES: LPXTG cell wall anchor domain-containing protein [Amycolatopsis]MBB2498373.1 LPXTG cell wall anchor domain-containing protein [Amycolatopsis echigonensis]PKV95417.1 LPXTG-motif cell wall-anchored protein [Amycolatopsis niigatensis]